MLTDRSRRVREARKLHRRAARARAGMFLAEGPKAVREALGRTTDARAGHVVEIFAAESTAPGHTGLLDHAVRAGVTVHIADDAALASLSETVTPQGLVAVCRQVSVGLDEALAGPPSLVAVLADVRDPGNAGTVIRCADAAGAGAVILAGDSVDPHGGKCVRASAGSLFHLPIVTGVPTAEALRSLGDRGLTIVAADSSGGTDLDAAQDDGLLANPTAWLFGNEAWGLPDGLLGLADRVVRIPIHGRAESLNLATAAALCLYASARAQRHGAGYGRSSGGAS
ncbi:MAG: TrmH family RNA methyltransferase [Jiangellaceae bacterium]